MCRIKSGLRRLTVLVLLMQCASFSLPAQVFPTQEKLPETKKIRRFTLPNGLRCVIANNPKPERRAEIRLFVNAGSLMEDDDQRGLAHVLEHLAFNGTKRFPGTAIIKYLESRGMDFGAHTNAYTSTDETVYQMQVPTDSLSVLETALDIVADWSSALILDSAAMENERKIVTEEWRLGTLGVQGRLTRAYFAALLRGTRYAERETIGTKSSLDTFRHEAVRRFYQDWYVPENMALVIVGDINSDSLEASIRQRLGSMPFRTSSRTIRQERALMRLVANGTDSLPQVAIFVDKELPNGLCETAWRGAFQATTTASVYRENLVRNMTLALINSRLQTIVASSTKAPFRSASVMWQQMNRSEALSSLSLEPSDALFTSYQAALAELWRVRRDGFLPSEIQRMKQTLRKGVDVSYNDRASMISRAVVDVCLNQLRIGSLLILPEDTYPLDTSIIAAIQPQELHQMAQKLFPFGTSAQMTFIASPPQDSAGINTEAVLQLLKRAEREHLPPFTEDTLSKPLLQKLPQSAKILRERQYPRIGVTEWQLSNGLRVVLKPTTFSRNQVLLQTFIPGGLSIVSESEYQAASRIMPLQSPATAGIGAFTPQEYTRFLAGKQVSAAPYLDGLYHGVSGNAADDDLETMLQIVYALHTSPRLDSANVAMTKDREKQAFSLRKNYPLVKFQDTIASVLYGNHYTARAITQRELEEWNHAAVGFPLYKRFFGNVRGGALVLVGAFDVKRIKPLILQYFGGLPSKSIPHRMRDVSAKPLQGVFDVRVRRGSDNQASTNVYYHDTVGAWSYRQDITFEVVQIVADTKLREALRHDAGGVYTSAVSINYSANPFPGLLATAAFPSEPERTEELKNRMNVLWKRLAEDGITQEDVQEAKTKLLKAREISMKDNSAWLGRLIFWTQQGESPERMLEYSDLVERMTLEDVRKAFRKVFLTPNSARFVLLPEVGK